MTCTPLPRHPVASSSSCCALDEVNELVRFLRTTVTVEISDIKDILLMDESGDGEVDICEYVLYMLKTTGQVDAAIVDGLESQFRALDTTNDGALSLADFPEGMGLRKTHSEFNGSTTTEIAVVALQPGDLTRDPEDGGNGGSLDAERVPTVAEAEAKIEALRAKKLACSLALQDVSAELETELAFLVKVQSLELAVKEAMREDRSSVASSTMMQTKLVV